jgi:hypothetical protein
MTGPEHYREAERLLAGTHFQIEGEPFYNHPSERDIAAAQVHATLALAAATATGAAATAYAADINLYDVAAWERAAGSTRPAPDEDDEDPDDGFTGADLHEMDQRDEAALDAEAGDPR